MMLANQKQMNFKAPNNTNNTSTTASTSNNPGTAYAVPKDENRNRMLKNVWNTGYDEIQDSWD